MFKFDLHIHTKHSPCSNLKPRVLLEKASERGLDVLAITDHNCFAGALEVKEESLRRSEFAGVTVILGIECKTRFGEIGVVFLEETELEEINECRDGRDFDFEALMIKIKKMKSRGSSILVGLNHPFASPLIKIDFLNIGTRGGLDFIRIVQDGRFAYEEEIISLFDFTEINSNNRSRRESELARALAVKYDLPLLCNSDSHFATQLGRFYSIGYAETVRQSIIEKRLDRHEPYSYGGRHYPTLIRSGVLKASRALWQKYVGN